MLRSYAAAIHVTGAGSRYPSKLCGRSLLQNFRHRSITTRASFREYLIKKPLRPG